MKIFERKKFTRMKRNRIMNGDAPLKEIEDFV